MLKFEFTEEELEIVLTCLLSEFIRIKESDNEDREFGEKIEDLIERINFKIDVHHACSQPSATHKASVP